METLLDLLKKKAAEIMGSGAGQAPVITRSRHRHLLQETLQYLSLYAPEQDLVFSAEHFRMAARSLGQFIGRIEVDDILDALFSQFCIGK